MPGAREERRYAAQACEQALKRPATKGAYAQRRREVMERVVGVWRQRRD